VFQRDTSVVDTESATACLHYDVIAHTVAVISVQSAVAGEALDDDLPAARAALARIREASGDTMRELRASVGLLRGVRVRERAGPGRRLVKRACAGARSR